MPKTKTKADLEVELEALRDQLRRLVAHTEVLAVALRTEEAVPRADLDHAVAGLHALYAELEG
jgi:hypothetical protein